MKKKIFLFFTVLLFFTPFATFSQETHDSIKLTERNDAFLNYDNYRSSITDTTIDVLKKLVELQTDLIITDNYIIHNYISINTKKTDDLQKKLQAAKLEKDLLNKKYKCSGLDMETTWRNQLNDQTKYQIITPRKLLNGIDSLKYKDLLNYLKTRYL